MTLSEFVKRFDRIKKKYGFRVLVRKVEIRGTIPDTDMPCCPITAVCYDMKDEYFLPDEFVKAGRKLELSEKTMRKIAAASDMQFKAQFKGCLAIKNIRKKLTKGLG
jgi:hypothetical protein